MENNNQASNKAMLSGNGDKLSDQDKDNSTDNVESSSRAQQISEDEARLIRLNAIRQQLSEGTYNISGKDVADKILKVIKG